MTDRELLQQALNAVEEYCEHNAMLRPIELREALKARLAQPEPEPVDKAGSPCPEFWDWLPKAYRDGDKGNDPKFTKYNMEVAYLAGKQSQPEPEPVAEVESDGVMRFKKIDRRYQVGDKLYLAPPQREWQGLTENDFGIWREHAIGILRWAEAVLKERNK